MNQLLTVNASNNKLSNFSLKASLHVLNLAQNEISQFPEIPSSVTDLNISKNKITEIPHNLQLPNLKNMDLSENQIVAVPKSFGSLKLKSKRSHISSEPSLNFSFSFFYSHEYEAKSAEGQETLQIH